MSNNTNYDVGVFYAPIWNYKYPNDPLSGKWGLINDYDQFLVNNYEAYKARIPANINYPSSVWYDETMPSVTSNQMALMRDHEIDFVVFDSYWEYNVQNGGYGAPYRHILDNIIPDPSPIDFHGMEFALMWSGDFTKMVAANGCDGFFQSGGGLDQMLYYWSKLLKKGNYKKIDNKPVFYIFYNSTKADTTYGVSTTDSIEGMCGYCKNNSFFAPLGAAADEPYINNLKTQYLLNYIENYFVQNVPNIDGIYFVAVINQHLREYTDTPITKDYEIKYDWLLNHPQYSGYSAVTSYGYKFFEYEDAYETAPGSQGSYPCNDPGPVHDPNKLNYLRWDYDYSKMQAVYQRYYNYFLNSVNHSNSTFDYQVPVTIGFHNGPNNKFYKESAQNVINNSGNYTQSEIDDANKTLDNLKFADACNDYTRDPGDQAVSTPTSFEQSLINAKNFADANIGQTKRRIMISAWNEYAEGNVLEPTYTWGTQYLDAVKTVFQ